MHTCEHTGHKAQCHHPKVDGSNFCTKHADEADRIKGYRLSSPELRERFEYHSNSDLMKSIKQEVVLLRTIIEDRANLATNPAERLAAFSVIHPAVMNLVKCFETLTKLERQNNLVLSKDALQWLSKEIVGILMNELVSVPNYEQIVDRVALRIAEVIANSKNQE